ncbi:MAG: hypothetical protein ABSA50_10180 [Candidatus Bathyarchaeia archaeon]|jgi:hypothetical protein
MSIVTNVLDRLGLTGALSPKIISFVPKLNLQLSQVLWKHFSQGQEWTSTKHSQEFQRESMARRALYEMQGRLPIAR